MIKAVVIAGNYAQYLNWLKETKNSKEEYFYAFREEQIISFSHGFPIILEGQCERNPVYKSKLISLAERCII